MEATALIDLAAQHGLEASVAAGDWLQALARLSPTLYGADQSESLQASARTLRDALLERLRADMLESRLQPVNRMKFGTSGWRGLLLKDFTAHNVGCVTQGLVETLLDPSLHGPLGVRDVADLRARGCVLAHDTRICGDEFVEVAARVLLAHDIPVFTLGTATTPEVSTAIHETHAACSINFTPSHNPFDYHGYKFNPADGGPAPGALTTPIAARANQILDGGLGYSSLSDEAWQKALQSGASVRHEDPVSLYRKSLKQRLPWLDLDALIDRINDNDITLFIDNGFGASRGKYEQILAGVAPEKLQIINGGHDYLFGGKSVEPSVENFRHLQQAMANSRSRFCLGVMNDGDGDRFVGGGRETVLVMNRFGPLVVRYLVREKGLRGDVTRSVMTSHMADAARSRYLQEGRLHETPVGFQHMRPYIPISVNSWEESDGMSPQGWNLDKDGLLAALLLFDMVLHHQQTPEELEAALLDELGYFYFERSKVKGKLSGDALSSALRERYGRLEPGAKIEIDGRTFRVRRVITLDGYKVVLEEGWWFGVRASGTEPVVRPYVETFTGRGAQAPEQAHARDWQQRILSWLSHDIAASIA